MDKSESKAATAALVALLEQTQIAHRKYELAELDGVYDNNWASWYARYLMDNGIGPLLDRPVSAQDLETRLREADASHRANARQQKWVEYYATFLAEG